MKKVCLICKREFIIKPYRKNIAKFCSKKCAGINFRNFKFSEETRKKMSLSHIGNNNGFKKGQISWNKGGTSWCKGKHFSEEHKKKIGKSNKGKHLSEETKIKISESHKGKSPWNKGIKFLAMENNPNWRGGMSFEPYSIDWKETLKRAIRERDKYICKICNLYGNIIHHIDYNKKNCNPNNLITLCRSCHTKTNYKRDYWIRYFQEISHYF